MYFKHTSFFNRQAIIELSPFAINKLQAIFQLFSFRRSKPNIVIVQIEL